MHPVRNDGHWSYNSKNVVLKVRIFERNNLATSQEFSLTFKPGEIIYDDFGFVRYFTYVNIDGYRKEYFAHEPDRDPTVQSFINAGKTAVSVALKLIQVYSYYRKSDELYQKYRTKELTGKEVVEDAAIWYLVKRGNAMMMSDSLHLIKDAAHVVHKNLAKLFPDIRQKNNITYYDTHGFFCVKGALYL